MSVMKERMHTGELYLPGDDEIIEWQMRCLDRLYEFNMTRPTESKKREAMLKEMFAEIGENCYIEPPFHANFGGAHVHFGKSIYANFNLTCVDDSHIYVGDYTMSRLPPPATPFCRNFARRHISTTQPCISAGIAGSGRERSSCPALRSVTMW